MAKRKVTIRLADDEVAVVGTIPQWQHLILIYKAYADEAEGSAKESWLSAADWIREALDGARTEFEEAW